MKAVHHCAVDHLGEQAKGEVGLKDLLSEAQKLTTWDKPVKILRSSKLQDGYAI